MKIHGNDKVGQVFITLNAEEYLNLAKDCLLKRPSKGSKYSYQSAKEELHMYANHVYNSTNSGLIYIYPPNEAEIGFLKNARNKEIDKNRVA